MKTNSVEKELYINSAIVKKLKVSLEIYPYFEVVGIVLRKTNQDYSKIYVIEI